MHTNAESLLTIGTLLAAICGGIWRFLPSRPKKYSFSPRNLQHPLCYGVHLCSFGAPLLTTEIRSRISHGNSLLGVGAVFVVVIGVLVPAVNTLFNSGQICTNYLKLSS